MPQITIKASLHEAILSAAADRGVAVLPGKPTFGGLVVEVSFEFYNWLVGEMVPGETFTQAITRLLAAQGKGMRVAR